jgi:hypothetical protein
VVPDEVDEWGDEEVGAGWAAAGGPGAGDDREGRAARRALRLAGAALAALVLAVVATILADGLRPGDRDSPAPQDATRLGPAAGVPVEPYAASRADALARVGGGEPRVAVVSLVSYRPVAAVGDLGVEVVAYLAALPGRAPEVVDVDGLAAWFDEQRASVEADRDGLAELLPTVEDPEFRASYQADLDRDERILATLGPDAEVVFGAVVRADGLALRRLAQRADVRLVDVFPRAWSPSVPTAGLRPEETTTAGDPPTRP